MDLTLSSDVIVFLIGTFVAALVVGVSGFAFGLVAAAIWLLALTPAQTTAMIVLYALLVQGYAVWKLRRAIVPARVWPFILSSAIGIPIGIVVLRWLTAGQLRLAVAVLLILFSVYNLLRPKMPSVAMAGRAGDSAIGLVNGILGGATGLAGIVLVIWSSLRGWKPDEQRAAFQPAAVATFLMCLPAFAGTGIFTAETVRLFVLGLPCLLLGSFAGWSLYGRLDEAAFRKVVLWLLLVSGIVLIFAGR
jgi:uncharacterized membrane protein YfcA